MTLPSDDNQSEWYSASVQLEQAWCYVEIRATSHINALDKLRLLFRSEVTINYVEIMWP